MNFLDKYASLFSIRLALVHGQRAGWIKWVALVAMVADHANRSILHDPYPLLTMIGRIAFPLFAVVLCANLAFAHYQASSFAFRRTAVRLLLAGLISQPIVYLLWGHAPLNIMLTFAAGLLLTRLGSWRFGALLLMGFYFDYYWFGLLFVSESYLLFKAVRFNQRYFSHLFLWCAALVGICVVNGNAWALCAIPLLLLAPGIELNLPRLKYFFYLFYPLHLTLFWFLTHEYQ